MTSGAIAGSGFNVDRTLLKELLGFRAVSPNSLDAVGDRDWVCELVFVAAMTGVHLSRLAEEVTWNHRPLDVERMAEAAQYLLGTHDFSAFRASQCQAKSPIKTVHHLAVVEHGRFIVLDIRANAFLHHMVRNIAGVLMAIGAGERPVQWAREVLERGERRSGGVTAHPYGLYLVQVEYPDEFQLPQRYLGPHFLSALPDVRAG